MDGLKCWNCGAGLDDVPTPISRHATCQQCFEVLHCCRMCRWFAPGRPQDCDHDRADPPVEKASANFCEFFFPTRRAFSRDEAEGKSAAQSKAAALFDNEDEATTEDNDAAFDQKASNEDPVRSKLDDLFDD